MKEFMKLLGRLWYPKNQLFISQFNYYVFKVSPNSTKMEIKNAVENIFKVEVKSVNTLNQKGKKKRFRGKVGVRAG